MSNATEQARSTRADARAFADAFAAADDAFTFGADAGESRTLTLDELGEVLALDAPVALPARRAAAPVIAETAGTLPVGEPVDDELLTLDELGDELRRRAQEADALDFDFGTSANERARRRTAARLEAAPGARRRVSGPAARVRERHAATARPGDTSVADAAHAAAEHLAAPGRFARADAEAGDAGLDRAGEQRRADGAAGKAVRADSAKADRASGKPGRASGKAARTDAGRTAKGQAVASREDAAPRRERPRIGVVDRYRANPDRMVMWAVLLGILLVLIAFTSGSNTAVALPLLSAF